MKTISVTRAAICGCALLIAAGLPGGRPTAAADGPFVIPVLLSLVGPFSPVGAPEGQTLPILESVINKSGGIKGRPVKFVVSDDQSNAQQTVLLFNQIAESKPAVVLGPGATNQCGAVAPIAAKNGPLLYCLSPGIHPDAGSYVFSSSVATSDTARVLVRYFRLHGWNRIAIITSTDGTGQDVEKQLDAILAMPENKDVTFVLREHFNPTDISVSAQMQHIRASNAQALLTWSTGTAFGTLLHGIHDAGLTIPVGASNGNMTLSQMVQYHDFLPAELYFPGVRGFSIETTRSKVQAAQAVYFDALKSAGLKPDIGPSLIWDPAMLVVDAYRKLGTEATAEQVRSYLSNLKGWAGINGVYDFTDRDHVNRGLGPDATVIYQWRPDKQQFAMTSKVAGYL